MGCDIRNRAYICCSRIFAGSSVLRDRLLFGICGCERRNEIRSDTSYAHQTWSCRVVRGEQCDDYEGCLYFGWQPGWTFIGRENNRIKKARIETDTGESFIVEFNDCVEFKMIELSWKVEPKKVKITILEVYKGTKYDDTCITSIDFLNRAWDK